MNLDLLIAIWILVTLISYPFSIRVINQGIIRTFIRNSQELEAARITISASWPLILIGLVFTLVSISLMLSFSSLLGFNSALSEIDKPYSLV